MKATNNANSDVGYQGPVMLQTQKCGVVKQVNAIPTLLLITGSSMTIHV